ncbi:helix-turn-helix domain-containing protein [Streptomyces sp. NPDC057746]|uniref:helix-turn-helix domain-containing protein n=1 Tax=Streptomyces sp. NPDC057746 TaxID=3346237 RepID=UPI003690E8EC
MTESPSPSMPPEAALIKAALKRQRIRIDDAAAKAGISRSRWSQIVAGYQSVGGQQIPVRAPDETLARMALAVGVTADQLREAGREEAAAALDELSGPEVETPTPAYANDSHIDAIAALLATLPPEMQDEVYRRVARNAPTSSSDEYHPNTRQRKAG